MLIKVFCADDSKQEKDLKDGERKKRKKTRWSGSEHDKTFIPGMPTVLPTNLTPEQEKAYLCKFLSFNIFDISFDTLVYM
jgi:hypothetical protein